MPCLRSSSCTLEQQQAQAGEERVGAGKCAPPRQRRRAVAAARHTAAGRRRSAPQRPDQPSGQLHAQLGAQGGECRANPCFLFSPRLPTDLYKAAQLAGHADGRHKALGGSLGSTGRTSLVCSTSGHSQYLGTNRTVVRRQGGCSGAHGGTAAVLRAVHSPGSQFEQIGTRSCIPGTPCSIPRA